MWRSVWWCEWRCEWCGVVWPAAPFPLTFLLPSSFSLSHSSSSSPCNSIESYGTPPVACAVLSSLFSPFSFRLSLALPLRDPPRGTVHGAGGLLGVWTIYSTVYCSVCLSTLALAHLFRRSSPRPQKQLRSPVTSVSPFQFLFYPPPLSHHLTSPHRCLKITGWHYCICRRAIS